MLSTELAKARNCQAVSWTRLAKQNEIPAPVLIAAALATHTPANQIAVAKLASRIRRGIGRAGGSLQVWLHAEHPHADRVEPIYKAANAEGYVPEYAYGVYSP
jgi:predicted TIM-barrel fold metal-dependent hydrolase